MLTCLTALPLFIKIILLVFCMIIVIVTAIFGRIQLSWGKIKINLGYNRKIRACKDCAIILRARGVKASRKIEKLERINLKNKMNFAEQQLLIVQRILFIEYTKIIKSKQTNNEDEHKELSSYHTKLQMAMGLLKDELRRAFKENGFHKLNDVQFDKYIKDESQIVTDTYCEYMLTGYPNGMAVTYDDVINIIESQKSVMNEYLAAILKKSKEIEIKTITDINEIEEQYELETNEFLGLNINNR